jgi:hypothetical protein
MGIDKLIKNMIWNQLLDLLSKLIKIFMMMEII